MILAGLMRLSPTEQRLVARMIERLGIVAAAKRLGLHATTTSHAAAGVSISSSTAKLIRLCLIGADVGEGE